MGGIFDVWPNKKDNVNPEPESVVGGVKPESKFDKAYDDLGSDYNGQISEEIVEDENEDEDDGEEETPEDNNIETI